MPELKNPSNEFLIKFSCEELQLILDALNLAELQHYRYRDEFKKEGSYVMAQKHENKADMFWKLANSLGKMRG